jgi:hypothetical protein
MEHDNAGLLKHLDELMEESRRVLAGISVRGGRGSGEYRHQQGVTRGLGRARQAVAEWFEEESRQRTSSQPETTV